MSFERLRVKADSAAELLSLIGNAKRLAILSLLVEGELTVNTIARRVSLSQSALSQHLARLRMAALVETRRERQMVYYSCRSKAVRELLEALDAIFDDGRARPEALAPNTLAMESLPLDAPLGEPHHY